MKLFIRGVPVPKQSARFVVSKGKVRSYQTNKVKNYAHSVSTQIISQLPKGFKPFKGPLAAGFTFIFPILESMTNAQKKAVENGEKIYKHTKPDLTDNLLKGVCDAMEGILYDNDAQIARLDFSEKIYGLETGVEITIYEISPGG